MPPIELIARAVIIRGNKVLLAKQKTESNTFLPGGHIEEGEYAEESLRRELLEELGVESRIGRFVGVLEHKFTDRLDKEYEEINLIFEASLDSEDARSIESHLEFMWVTPEEFEEANLLPSSLQVILPGWMKEKTPFHSLQKD